jgi:hypothetical protein
MRVKTLIFFALDFGDEGCRDTRDALTKTGVKRFGGGDILTCRMRGVKIGFPAPPRPQEPGS